MDKQQPDPNPKNKSLTGDKLNRSHLQPKPGRPMDKFNNAMRKILSVPKKNIKKK